MSNKLIGQLFAIGTALWLGAGVAQAQTAPTCFYDSGTATVTVTVDGEPAIVSRNAAGAIRVGGVACDVATVTNTDMIIVNGGPLADRVTFNGSFAPGLTAEDTGASEIEITLAMGDGNDTAVVNFTDDPETILFTAGGIDIGNDLDEDITTAGVEAVRVYGKGGDDTIDATSYLGGGRLSLYGGIGADIIIGSAQNDSLYGQEDGDTLTGNDGNDALYGGHGDDSMSGNLGNDRFVAEATVDGNDDFLGGDGRDTVDYSRRTVGVAVDLGNALADEGQPGVEFDFADNGIENATGGSGADVLVGDGAVNVLNGKGGADELFGGGGNDTLRGGDGGDILVGDAGRDTLFGEAGIDSLDGGIGDDRLWGGIGNDSLDGGPGVDEYYGEAGNDFFFNDDGIAEIIDCGPGTMDDPEPSANDSYLNCELI
jgi:Ca2+-binding RTX toxin-like protein